MNKHTEHNDNEQRINRNSQPRKQQPTIKNKKQSRATNQKQRTWTILNNKNKNKTQPQRTQ